jgi:hypothetical protein
MFQLFRQRNATQRNGANNVNRYEFFYQNKRGTVEAPTSFEAQKIAAIRCGARKRSDVTVILVEAAGQVVVHSPAELG